MRTSLSFVLGAIILHIASISFSADFVWKPSEKFNLSLDNERLAAIDRASSWLLQRQESDGSFERSSRATSLSLLALFILNDFTLPPAGERAKEWLCANEEAEASPWREVALKAIQKEECEAKIEPQSELERLLLKSRQDVCNGAELAHKLIISQRVCKNGTGSWGGDIADTAAALILLMEVGL